MDKKRLSTGIVLVLLITFVLGSVLFLFPSGRPVVYSVQPGDYITYQISTNRSSGSTVITLKVLAINETNVFFETLNGTANSTDIQGFSNESVGSTAFFSNPKDQIQNVTLQYGGVYYATTKWGVRAEDYYFANTPIGSDQFWFIRGSLAREVLVRAQFTMTFVAIDSNMDQFIKPNTT